MRTSIGRILAAALLTALASAAKAEERALSPLPVAYVASNAAHWDIDVAIDKGLFRDEGFAPEPTAFQSSPQSIQLLVTGAIALTSVEPESAVSAILRGASIGALAQQEYRPDWLLMVRPEIKDWADLKGKTLGFSALTTAEIWLTRQLLSRHGLAKTDWAGIQVGTSAAKYAALQKGSIAGSVLFQPLARRAVEAGFRSLAAFTEIGNYPPTLLTVRRDWAAEKGNGMRLGRAITRAHQWLYDPGNHDEALAILEKYTKCDAAVAEQLYRSYFVTDKLYIPDAAIDLAAVKRVTDVMAELGELPKGAAPRPEQFVVAKEAGGLWRQ